MASRSKQCLSSLTPPFIAVLLQAEPAHNPLALRERAAAAVEEAKAAVAKEQHEYDSLTAAAQANPPNCLHAFLYRLRCLADPRRQLIGDRMQAERAQAEEAKAHAAQEMKQAVEAKERAVRRTLPFGCAAFFLRTDS